MLENWVTDHVYRKYLSPSNVPETRDTIPETPLHVTLNNDVPGSDDTRDSHHSNAYSSARTCASEFSENTHNKNTDSFDVNPQSANSLPRSRYKDTINARGKDGGVEFIMPDSQNRILVKTEIRSDQHQHNSDTSFGSSKGNSHDASPNGTGDNCDEITNPTERPFTKLLSIDERIDMLIAGERKKERDDDVTDGLMTSSNRHAPTVSRQPPSFTSTFTSITSDSSSTSEWYNRIPLTYSETTSTEDAAPRGVYAPQDATSETTSYWWDVEDNAYANPEEFLPKPTFNRALRRRINVNVTNDKSTIDELRQQRIRDHLVAVRQTR